MLHAWSKTLKSEQKHQVFDTHISKGNYACSFEVSDQILICDDIPVLFNGFWMIELEELRIAMSLTQELALIEVFMRADLAKEFVQLRSKFWSV